MLASAEILSQLTISTLIGNTVLESSSEPTTPLRITLLGMAGTQDSALISFPTTMAFDGLRLSFNSGVASALTSLEVSAACAVASPSP